MVYLILGNFDGDNVWQKWMVENSDKEKFGERIDQTSNLDGFSLANH